MITKPFPDPADGSSLAAGDSKGTLGMPPKRTSLLGSLGNQLPRAIGAGLLGLYLIGLVPQLLDYKWADPTANYTLASQLLERTAFLLLGYALLFWPGLEDPRRKTSRVALKLASHSTLAACLLHLALGVLCVYATEQLYRRDLNNLNLQNHNQVVVMQRAQKEAPTLGEAQLHLIYIDLVQGAKLAGKTPPLDVMRAAVAELAGSRVKEINTAADLARSQLVRGMVLAASKYAAIALLGFVLFFIIWDQTPRLRTVRIFAPSTDPNLVLASRLARQFQRMQLWGEKLFTPPDMEKYRWYRHLRRWFQRRFKKK